MIPKKLQNMKLRSTRSLPYEHTQHKQNFRSEAPPCNAHTRNALKQKMLLPFWGVCAKIPTIRISSFSKEDLSGSVGLLPLFFIFNLAIYDRFFPNRERSVFFYFIECSASKYRLII